MKLILVAVAAVVLSACSLSERYDEVRRWAEDRVANRWCELTDEEKVVVAERRDYSDEFVTYLESKCDVQQ